MDEHPDNPVAAVQSIICWYRHGRPLPAEAMEWLALGLERWYSLQGTKSLEQCLGLRRPSGQAANQMKETIRGWVVDAMLSRMLRLHLAFGITATAAAHIVASFMEESGWNRTAYEFKPLSVDTLLAYWTDFDLAKNEELRLVLRKKYMDEEARHGLLDQYPRHAWQHLPELKAYL